MSAMGLSFALLGDLVAGRPSTLGGSTYARLTPAAGMRSEARQRLKPRISVMGGPDAAPSIAGA